MRQFVDFIFITLTAVFIWAWAATETREETDVTVRLQLTSAANSNMLVRTDSESINVNLKVEGSSYANDQVKSELARGLFLQLGKDSIPSEPGEHTISLAAVLDAHRDIVASGARVIAAEPAQLTFEIIEGRTGTPIRAALPNTGLELTEAPVISPAEATIYIPEQLARASGREVYVEAVIDPQLMRSLEPGRRHTLPATLRPPAWLGTLASIDIDPGQASVTLSVRSQIQTTVLETVRIQIAGDATDLSQYTIAIDDAFQPLRNVSIEANATLIQRIEANEAKVVAIVYFTARDMETAAAGRLTSRPVSWFEIITTDESGPRGQHVTATTVDNVADVQIEFNVTKREEAAAD